jgi:hypothetical protein
MNGLNLWKGNKKTKDYQFQDRIAKEFVNRSGTVFMVHKYIGPYKQDPKDSSLFLPQNEEEINEMTIQDVLLGENRDRKYSEDLFELKGVYTVSDTDFDLSMFGAMLSGDSIVVEFHTNDSIEKIGRKLMTGDVIEVVHLRDDTTLDSEAGIVKKYYVVQDSNRSAGGYGPTWFSHIWKTRCTPIVDTQEYRDILHNQKRDFDNNDIDWLTDFAMTGESDSGVKDLSRTGDETEINNHSVGPFIERETTVIREHQRKEVEKRSSYVKHLYIKSDDEQTKTGLIQWMLNGDGTPENYAGDILFSGTVFPENPSEGDFFVRTDYVPERLFKRVGPVWRKVSEVWRRDWVPAHRILESFLDNDNITTVGIHEDQTFNEKQALSEVVLPKSKQKPKIVPKG